MIEKIAAIFENYAPLSDADRTWDNVGVLVKRSNVCKKILITVDLTMEVVDECLRKQVQNVIAYHPIIFHPIKSISDDECVVAECVHNNISVYCPHTALDRKMNEHLLAILAGKECALDPGDPEKYMATGQNTRSIAVLIEEAKGLTGAQHIRVSFGKDHGVHSVPAYIHVGVGAAPRKVREEDSVVVTGEMSHHSLLYCARRNVTVLLLEHSNSERIFFKKNKHVFDALFKDFEVILSESDKDPVVIL